MRAWQRVGWMRPGEGGGGEHPGTPPAKRSPIGLCSGAPEANAFALKTSPKSMHEIHAAGVTGMWVISRNGPYIGGHHAF